MQKTLKRVKKLLKKHIQLVNQLLTSLIIVMICASFLLMGKTWIKLTLASATTVKQEYFTELYFENHNNLPKLVESGRNYSFKFTIHNSTKNDNNYSYSAYYEFNGAKYFIDNGKAFIKQDKYKSLTETFTPTINMPRVKVTVELTENHQKISFWTELLQ